MKWLIKSPAPGTQRGLNWGDHHFAQSLARALQAQGAEVLIQPREHWYQSDESADIVLVLRGLHRYQRRAQSKDTVHVIWNISHPDAVADEEWADYDLICPASMAVAARLEKRFSGRVLGLLQCTDTERFRLPEPGQARGRQGIIFVGNSRGVSRPVVDELASIRPPIRVWGLGWERFGHQHLVVADNCPNEKLGELYRQSLVSLNDHWPDMTRAGYINNRIFDALACGLPILSDIHAALLGLMGHRSGIVYAAPGRFQQALAAMLLELPRHLKEAEHAAHRVRLGHSFDARAQALIDRLVHA